MIATPAMLSASNPDDSHRRVIPAAKLAEMIGEALKMPTPGAAPAEPKLSAFPIQERCIPICLFCDEPLTSRSDSWLDFYNLGCGLAPFFSHTQCGPDCGYAIRFDRLIGAAAVEDWENHLVEKDWFGESERQALRRAAEIAELLAE